ncbi:MAG: aminotransferase class V-fold PLP-dependent enzyme, partial [Mogibacterium sp.]|nr:aminotransferase class V-fold PLP-dependent enzyme [Mogibacterium sp.]
KTIVIKSNENGTVDIEDLKAHLGPKTAGLMLTNPNTVGLFDPNIMEITKLVHEAGGLCYYDGANLNAVIGIVRPADIGFDVIHMNLHKTFSTPHGGGGPGSGPCAYKDFLAPFAPGLVCKDGENYVRAEKSLGNMTGFYGNFLVMVKAYTYLLTIGKDVHTLAENAVLNANYMQEKLKDLYPIAFDTTCMHEFVIGLDPIYRKTHVSALDVAKALLDYGIHPPTIYFPLIVHEALMIEPTETETKETLDEAITAFREIYDRIFNAPETVQMAPQTTPVLRLDDTKAARDPHLRFTFE